ncbi:hypothetical protein MNB_SM-4-334 [hydrothermal vent metagenome]|uniref:Imelysin-like domain-containing protein n=1 Tax=hydrothermal vent metagenome TaxID=652676 RepID=A0A1W1BL45_9ZZZZ
MKKIYTTLFSLLLSLSFVGCGSDNGFDGENGLLASGGANQSAIETSLIEIYNEVILKDINASYEKSLSLIQSVQDLNTSTSATTLSSAQVAFKELVLSYKRVESTYVAGRESDNMRDIADFYLEQFIFNSKGDTLFTDLQKIFDGTGSLYKNSHKGITALEYTLFDRAVSDGEMLSKLNTIRLASAITMAQTISQNLLLVKNYYNNESTFLTDSDTAISLLLNQLVDNAYKLKEKRIGDAGGFTVNFLNNPDATRLEYYKSIYSLAAIKEILFTHKSIMDKGLTNIATLGSASSEADAIVTKIDEALVICDSYTNSLESDIATSKTKDLFDTVAILQTNYTALINGLNFQQDLLEADGD